MSPLPSDESKSPFIRWLMRFTIVRQLEAEGRAASNAPLLYMVYMASAFFGGLLLCRFFLLPVLRWLLPFVVLLFVSSGHAFQAVPLTARWRQGEKRTLEIVSTRERTRGSEVVQRARGTSKVELEVIEASTRGFVVRWTYRESRFDDPNLSRVATTAEELIAQFKDVKIEVQTDAGGDFESVRNWQELKTFAEKLVDTITSASPTLTEPQRVQTRQLMKSWFATRAQVENMLAREIRMYHLVLGGSFESGKRVPYDELLPNPFGGEPFPAKASFLLKEHNAALGRAVVEWQQTLDPQATRRILMKVFADLAQKLGKPAPKESEVPAFDISDQAEIVIDTRTGWLKTLTQKRTTTTTAMGQPVKEVRTLTMTDKGG